MLPLTAWTTLRVPLTALLVSAVFLNSQTIQAQTGQAWSLERCIDYAQDHNLDARQQDITIQRSEVALKQSKLSQIPSVNGSTSYAFTFGLFTDPVTNLNVRDNLQSNNFQISAGLPVFQGLRIRHAIRQNEINVDLGRLDREAIEDGLAVDVAASYLSVLLNQAVLDVARTNSALSAEQFNNSNKLVDNGVIPEGDLLDLIAQMANDTLQIINAENNVTIAYVRLKNIMQYEEEADFQVEAPSDEFVSAMLVERGYNAEEVLATAENNFAALIRGKVAVESAEKGIALARAFLWPSVSLFGSIDTRYSDLQGVDFMTGNRTPPDAFGVQMEENFGQAWGVSLSVPIFNGWQVQQSVRNAELSKLSAELSQLQVIAQYRQIIEQAVADQRGAASSYRANVRLVEASSNALDFSEKRFNAGQTNTLDYTIARNNLTVAQTNLVQAKYNYLFALMSLEFYLGRPMELGASRN
jgi:outer membrane protein